MEKQYKSPVERMLKKNFDEMDKSELIKIRVISSLIAGCMYGLGMFLWEKLGNNVEGFGIYLLRIILFAFGWYLIFWYILLKRRKIK